MFLALFAHIFRPDTGLYLTDMRLAQIEHTEAGLPYTATDGKRQCIIHQAFVEVRFRAFLFAFLCELAKQGFLVREKEGDETAQSWLDETGAVIRQLLERE